MTTEKPSNGHGKPKRILVTGGCGFIGINLISHYLNQGHEVITYDNLSRPGSKANAEWLAPHGDGRLMFVVADVRDFGDLCKAMDGVDLVVHLAAQVAVTTSVRNPRQDFMINALGGFNVLEAARNFGADPIVLYASTNKVYGSLEGLRLSEGSLRYGLRDYRYGIPEGFPIDLHSPYGCSKGAADLYMLDYARIFGLRSAVFRQSCIYGPHQFGIEDQGWVAHFVISALKDRPITIYGDGRQVRDVLHVADLIRAFDLAVKHIDVARGQAYNIGGGPLHTLSLLELIHRLEATMDKSISLRFDGWRPGDQRVYVSDIRKAERDLGWIPEIDIDEGMADLCSWLEDNLTLFQEEPFDVLRALEEASHANQRTSTETIQTPSVQSTESEHAVATGKLRAIEAEARRRKKIASSLKERIQ